MDLAIITIANNLQLFQYEILWKLEKSDEERTPAERCGGRQKMSPAPPSPPAPGVSIINNLINRAELSLPARTTGGSLTWGHLVSDVVTLDQFYQTDVMRVI